MGLFKLDAVRQTSADDKKALSRIQLPNVQTEAPYRTKGANIQDLMASIVEKVETVLGKYRDMCETVTTIEQLERFTALAEANGVVSIDTENTGLDELHDSNIGWSAYTPGSKTLYVPIAHTSYVTGMLAEGQLTAEQCKPYLERLKKVKTVWHHAKYDIRIAKHNFGTEFTPYWCCMIAGRMLNERDDNSLKGLYKKYIDPDMPEYDFRTLFPGVDFRQVPIRSASVYAALDAYLTFKVYEYQKRFLDPESKECQERGLVQMGHTFLEIEVPIIKVVADMEDLGVCIDDAYLKDLSDEYEKILQDRDDYAHEVIAKYQPQIDKWNMENPNNRVPEWVNLGSVKQLSVLLYKALGLKSKIGKTDKFSLQEMNHEVAWAILAWKEFSTLVKTFIRGVPAKRSWKTGKVHTHYNTYGADTGRFSSSDPNLQNIPSHDKRIRQMFVPEPGHRFIGCDFSQQEPRILAHMSQDPNLLEGYATGKDAYAIVASEVYHLPYEQCIKSAGKEAEARRDNMKDVMLGVMYRRGAKSVADKKGIPIEDAVEMIEQFYAMYPRVREWQDEVLDLLHTEGYALEAFGRKRRMPDGMLERYTLEQASTGKNFDPLAALSGKEYGISPELEDSILSALYECRNRFQVEQVKKKAESLGIKIRDNGAFIAEAERQAINFGIQGTAATQTKLAMLKVAHDPECIRLGVKNCLQVHDEIIVQVPAENAEAAAERVSYVMSHAADDIIKVPMKCDTVISDRWYGEFSE